MNVTVLNHMIVLESVQFFQNSLILATLVGPQTAIFGILDSASNDYIFKNNLSQIPLIFKSYVYKS